MTCSSSKLFSGDLPEISSYIIQNLRNNFGTLYSLALVNRFWCRLAIPLLWEDPFSIRYRKNFSFYFIDTYFLSLNDSDKSKLKEIIPYEFDSNSQKPLFNYPSLIKTINISRIQLHVSNWTSNIFYTSTSLQKSSDDKFYTFKTYCTELQYSVNRENFKVVCLTLFKLFIENNASLNNLYMKIDALLHHIFYDICDMILENPKFISELFYFGYYIDEPYHYLHTLSYKLFETFFSSLPSSIKHIEFCSGDSDFVDFKKHFANIIRSQSQLSSIKTGLLEVNLLDSLKCRSNTLTAITFDSCQFHNTMRFDELSYLTQLESLQFKSCYGLNSNVIQPLLNITTPLKIKTLVIVESSLTAEVFTSIQLLIQKIGPYIENLVLFIYKDELRKKFFDVIIDSCEKIKFLNLNHVDLVNISQLSKMFFNFNNYLKYLTLRIKFRDVGFEVSSMILKELSKSLPQSLHYLDLNLIINPDDLRIAFENFNQVKLKSLLIRDGYQDNEGANLKVIKDFVKEKNIEFLSYSIGTDDEKRHKGLEILVEEIQSFTKMMRYTDLVIKVDDIDGNLEINH